MNLEMECSRCSVAKNCPRYGTSPITLPKNILRCRIVGGFGRVPIDKAVLSKESAALYEKNGPCLTVAEIPSVDDQGYVLFEVVKIFSPPCLSDRETKVPTMFSNVEPRSHNT